jgi:hypothetical protein
VNLEQRIRRDLLLADVGLLNEAGCEDKTLALLGGEHAARTEQLVKAVQCPTYGRALALELSQQFLNIAQQIEDASYQEPELIHVG